MHTSTPSIDPGGAGSSDPVVTHPYVAEADEAEDAFDLGVRLAGEDRLPDAEDAFRLADDAGHAAAAFNLGVLLAYRGDPDGAAAAYGRAAERGLADGAYELGMLLATQHRLSEAEEAFARADQAGHAGAATKLGVLLEEAGDIDGAAAAYFRADERGDADGAFELGLLLVQHDQFAEAEAAFGRAAARGHDAAAHNLAVLSEYRRCDGDAGAISDAGHPVAERPEGMGAIFDPAPNGAAGTAPQTEPAADELREERAGYLSSAPMSPRLMSTPALTVNLARDIMRSEKRAKPARIGFCAVRRRLIPPGWSSTHSGSKRQLRPKA